MSDNVIKFERRPKPKPPRQTPPWLKRLLAILAVIAFFVAAFAYFTLKSGASGPTF
ncbi:MULTISPECIES: hypothetical protein [Rhizobium]|uniref:hypothetical protein n=1 Tax=Rhizobium TaxID=379 RepID=UPI00146F53F3|nr:MULTISPECIES: hypothetical protein [Rhizobium]MBB3400176.1 hypothetical protein [Rhizobium sp. BK289]MBB3480642.1 hypothetical protein [Rhizobium sp. BK347]MDK4719301.1 hypothetical protein [Rhizobium sp. CNPSo 3968]